MHDAQIRFSLTPVRAAEILSFRWQINVNKRREQHRGKFLLFVLQGGGGGG